MNATLPHDIEYRHVECQYDDYLFTCDSITGQPGAIFSFPFIDSNGNFTGYHIYHDPKSYGVSRDELFNIGMKAINEPSLSGMVCGMAPLPYKPIGEDDIEMAIDRLIINNTVTDFSKGLKL